MTYPGTAVFFYNRPDKLRALYAALASIKPPRLFLIADGPNPTSADDVRKCRECRDLARHPSWPCQVFTLFRENHLGAKQSISRGLLWVFSQTPEAIILEDDCIPSADFFRFASELLHRYRAHDRVKLISGRRIDAPDNTEGGESYFLSAYTLTHGWATWSRAIEPVDWEMARWPELRNTGWLENVLGNPKYVAYWTWIFDRMVNGMDAWDYALSFDMFLKNGLCIVPSVNLVENIGFDASATNTTTYQPGISDRKIGVMRFPLIHPDHLTPDKAADDRLEWLIHSGYVFRQLQIARQRIHQRRHEKG